MVKKNKALHAFTLKAIAFRKAHPCLGRTSFFKGENKAGDFPDIRWYGPEGAPVPDWEKGTALACRIDGRRKHTGADREDQSLYLIFNGGDEPQTFELPPHDQDGVAWELELTTQERAPVLKTKGRPLVTVDGASITAFVAR